MQGNRAPGDEQVKSVLIEDDGRFPNNGLLPLLLYRKAIRAGEGAKAARFSSPDALASEVEAVFHRNGWGGSWRNGIYGVHHYHSTAHEALGVFSGSARVQLGGESGPVFDIEAGDVVVIPAGVAHKRIESSPDFSVVGAYPEGQRPDMRYGAAGERPGSDETIARVSVPRKDPAFGSEGPLIRLWHRDGGLRA
jgi:uncharacterized protein YjlB